MKAQTTRRTRLALLSLIIATLGLSGCGAQTIGRDGSTSSSSRTTIGDAIECNQFASENASLNGRLMIYTAPNGTEHNDILRLRVTGLDSSFDSNANVKIRLYRIEGRADGSWYRDPEPLEMRVELPRAGAPLPLTGYATSLSLTDVERMKAAYGISASKSSDFFNQVDILVFGVETRWDVLQIALNDDGGGRSIGHANVLMPAFSADPVAYASDHPTGLAELHPFWYRRGVDYAAESLSWCF